MLKGNAIIGQSGGPTSVINSSLAGVIKKLKEVKEIENIFEILEKAHPDL